MQKLHINCREFVFEYFLKAYVTNGPGPVVERSTVRFLVCVYTEERNIIECKHPAAGQVMLSLTACQLTHPN